MANRYSIVAGSTALVAATAKTMVELATPSTGSNSVIRYSIAYDGTDASKTPVLAEWIRYTTTGTGTAYTPNKINEEAGPAATTTAKINLTVEGTGSITIIDSFRVSPTATWAEQFPLAREITMKNSSFLGLRLTAAAAVNALVTIWIEE